MKKKLLILSGVGFAGGMMIGNLIPLLACVFAGSPIQLYSDRLLSLTRSPIAAILVQTPVSGLYGAICMGGTVVYDVEHWPMLRALLIHYAMCMISYLPISLLLGWNENLTQLLIAECFQIAGFFIIWLIIKNNNKVEFDVPAAAKSVATFYLIPNSDWKNDGARFALYVFNNDVNPKAEAWFSGTEVESGIYKFSVSSWSSYKQLIFCRMNGGTVENNWGNKWNQTGDLNPVDNSNVFNITSWSDGNWNI